tara:strand:- start:127 stop:360 length:234 start_codon:yes stop_codon:yes gene_type:complete
MGRNTKTEVIGGLVMGACGMGILFFLNSCIRIECKGCNKDTNTVVGVLVSYDGTETITGWGGAGYGVGGRMGVGEVV